MSLGTKLKFSTNYPLAILKAPDTSLGLFEGFTLKNTLAGKKVKQVILFVLDKKMLDEQYPKVIDKLEEDGIFWIAYPKKSEKIPSDLIRNSGWDIVFNSEYRIVSSAAINDEWTAVRIAKKKPETAYKSSVPMQQRTTPGVDYVNRSTELPEDVKNAMKSYKGLEAFFYQMSFSHQREYIESIEEAKKPETRQRRISKMVEMVWEMKSKKELKKTK